MEEINNFQQKSDENLYQAWERFKELLMKCRQHYLTEMLEVVLFYNGLDVPTRHILDSRGAIPSKTAADAKIAIQEMVEYSQKWHNGTSRVRSTETSDGLGAIQAQLNNLGREIKKVNEKVYTAQVGYAAIRNQGASIKTLEIQIRQMSKSISTTIEADSYLISRIGSSQYVKIRDHMDHNSRKLTLKLYDPYPKKKDPRSFTLPCFINNVCFNNSLVDLGASVSVMPLSTYLNLGLGELAHTKLIVELADRTVKYPKGIAENVLV
ncbi:NUDIX hydrolase 6-like protein [Tanacetum coccineum]